MEHSPSKGCRQQFGNNKNKEKNHIHKSKVNIFKNYNRGKKPIESESRLTNELLRKIEEMEKIERRGRLIQPIFLDASKVEVLDFITVLDKGTIFVEEVSNNLLGYGHPGITMQATVRIPPIPLGTNIQVGWIQVVTEMKQINLFEKNEFTSWQIPKLTNGEQKMVNDSSGILFPWAEIERGLNYLEGPIRGFAEVTVQFRDAPCSRVCMFMPMNKYLTAPTLKFVYRKQNFCSYLVLKNFQEDNYQIIKAIEWIMEVAIGIDPKKPLGKRVVFVGPCELTSPKVLNKEETPPLEKYALESPAANDCQIFVGRCKNKPIEVVKNPPISNIDIDNYLFETEDCSMKLLNLTQENYFLQEKLNI